MADADESPLKTAATTAGREAAAAFDLLSDETRLAILLALWEANDPHAGDDAVSFSELRERVGVADSGQFNYHLRKLEGPYVRKTDEGYSLQPVGLKLVQTVIADADRSSLAPTEIDVACPLCGASTAVRSDDGWLFNVCTSCEGAFPGDGGEHFPAGALFGEPFSAAALAGRSPEELFAAAVFQLVSVVGMKMGGVCPRCSGRVTATLGHCEAHDAVDGGVCTSCGNVSDVRARWVCSVCKYRGTSSPGGAVIAHPAVVAFYHDHGVDVGGSGADFEAARDQLARFRRHTHEVTSTDPLRVRVTVPFGDDALRLTLDDSLAVLDVARTDRPAAAG